MSSLVKTLITLAFFLISRMILGLGKKKWDPKGKVCSKSRLAHFHVVSCRTHVFYQHVYITGGSQGLGFALAKILVKRGANISIVARTQSKLDSALRELEVGIALSLDTAY